MQNLLQLLIRFILRHLFAFCLIVIILLAGQWAVEQFKAYRSLTSDLAILSQGEREVEAQRGTLAEATTARVQGLGRASVTRIGARIAAIDQAIALKSGGEPAPVLTFPLPGGGTLAQRLVEHSRRAVEIELLDQERAYLTRLQASLYAGMNRQAAREQLLVLHREHTRVYQAYLANARLIGRLRQDQPLAVRLPGTAARRQFLALAAKERSLRAQNALAQRRFAEHKATSSAPLPGVVAAFKLNQARLDAVLEPLADSIVQGQTLHARNWVERALGPVKQVAPTAALLVLLALLIPVAIKALFYFVLAPMAARLRPMALEEAVSPLPDWPGGLGKMSAPSISLTIDEGHELLIQSEFIQSSSINGKKDTKWLLDWSCPLTSLAAGLVALTRVRVQNSEFVVISATGDPLLEVAALRLPAGAAMVFQPRGLVGVMVHKDAPLTITRHWRLNSLHAWLTLQLRYLVFRGPVTLIVKGCRGVRIEAAGDGRNISQSATLGFSANVAYSTIRSETFFPYLISKQALFNDRFEGACGSYVYEETARSGKRSGIIGAGFKGLGDALLKVFGI